MAEVEIKERKACRLAYIEHVGDYGKIPFNEYISRLYDWAKENKVRPGDTMGIFYDCPDTTPPEKCRSEIAIPIVGKAKPGRHIKVKEFPAMNVAMIKHRAPAKEYSETYRKLSEWIAKNSYVWVGPSIEIYSRAPKVAGNEVIIYADIQAPVRKK